MKKVVFIGALVLSSSFAFSQTNTTTKDGANCPDRDKRPMMGSKDGTAMKDRMAKELNLSEAQIKKISEIDDKYKSQEENLRTQSEALRNQKQKLREEKRSEIEKVFTEDQKQKLKDMKEKFHSKRGMQGKMDRMKPSAK